MANKANSSLAVASLWKAWDERYAKNLPTAEAVVESVTRDSSGQAIRAFASIDGASCVQITVPYGAKLAKGTVVKVANEGSLVSPSWVVGNAVSGVGATRLYDFPEDATAGGELFHEGDALFGNPAAGNMLYRQVSNSLLLRMAAEVVIRLDGITGSATFGSEAGNNLRWDRGESQLGFYYQDRPMMIFDGETQSIIGLQRIGSPLGPSVEFADGASITTPSGMNVVTGIMARDADGIPYFNVNAGSNVSANDVFVRIGGSSASSFIESRPGLGETTIQMGKGSWGDSFSGIRIWSEGDGNAFLEGLYNGETRLKFDNAGNFYAYGYSPVSHSHDLDDLLDVVISGTPADNEILAYDTSTNGWINQTPAEAGLAHALDGAMHTIGALTANYLVMSNGSILASASNTDAQVAAAVSASHAAMTLATSGDTLLGLAGQALSLDTQTANFVFAGATSGASAAPTFRALVDADIPAAIMRDSEHTGIGDGAPHQAALTLSTSGDTLLGLAGQALSLDTQAANIVLAGPATGAAAAPTFRAVVAADIPAGIIALSHHANMATASLFYRKTAGDGAPEVNSLATLKTDLLLTGTNSGDTAPNSTATKAAKLYYPLPVHCRVLNLATTDADLKGFYGGFTDGRYGYFVPCHNNAASFGKVARVDLTDFSTVSVLNLASTDAELVGFRGGFTDGRYGYFVPDNNGVVYLGKVARVDLTDFSTVSVLNLASTDADLKGFYGGFTDGRYGYFVPYNNGVASGKVARVDLTDFSTVSVLNLALTDVDLKGFQGGFTDGRYGYFVPNNDGAVYLGKVARVDLANFSTVSVLNLALTDAGLKGFAGGFTDGRYGYFVPYHNSSAYFGKVARVDLTDFATVTVLNLVSTDSDLKGFHGGFTDGRYGYFVPYYNGGAASFGKVARVDLTDFSTVSVLNLASTDADLKGFFGGFTDGRYGYFAPYYDGAAYFGKVARIPMQFGGNL